jgi:hypothetical protein
MEENPTRDPIPDFNSLEEIADFWDKHSTADYADLGHEVRFEVKLRESSAEYQTAVQLLPESSEISAWHNIAAYLLKHSSMSG